MVQNGRRRREVTLDLLVVENAATLGLASTTCIFVRAAGVETARCT